MDSAVLDSFLPALQGHADVELLAAYSVPPVGDGYFLSYRFQPALLLLLAQPEQMHAARRAIQSLHMDWNNVLEAPPFVFTPSDLRYYTRLHPLFASHLATHAERLCGDALPLAPAPAPHPIERLAFLLAEAVDASAALAPQKADPLTFRRLQRLAQELSDQRQDSSLSLSEDGQRAVDLFADLQVHLRLLVDSLPPIAKQGTKIVKDAAEPNLLAIYEDQERLLVIIPPLSGKLLREIDWSALSRAMSSNITTLNVASADQLYLTIHAARALDFVLGGYRRQWGVDLLSGLRVTARAVFRQAARRPSSLLGDGLLGAYLLAPDDEAIHRIIHDYQNRLLNLRLEHELLCRLLAVPRSEPKQPLPRRDEPPSERIEAIAEHLRWWTRHYLRQMDTYSVEHKLSPT